MYDLFQTSPIYGGHKCPSFNLSIIFKRRNNLLAQLAPYYGLTLTAANFEDFTAIFKRNLPRVELQPIDASLRYLIGQTLTKDKLVQIAWRLVGNLPILRTGEPVYPWLTQRYVEWVPLIIHATELTNNGRIMLSFRVLAGTPCPATIVLNWTEKMIRFISRKIGFTPDHKKRPLGQYNNVVGMLFAGCMLPSLSAIQPTFAFDSVHCLSSMLDNNKKLIDSRNRDITPCPIKFDWNCYRCFIGRDKCNRAIRLITKERKEDDTSNDKNTA